MRKSKTIICILITLFVIGAGISVLWASTKAGPGDTLEDWIGNQVDILTIDGGDNHYRVKLLSVVAGNPSGIIVEDNGMKTFIYHDKIFSIKAK